MAGYQSRLCGSAPTNLHRRASNSVDFGVGQGMVFSTPGGALSAGRVGPGSGMVGWLSPAEAKVMARGVLYLCSICIHGGIAF